MHANVDDSIDYVVLKNRSDTDIAYGLMDRSWESMVDIFTRHEIRGYKNGAAIIPALFKDESEWLLTPDPKSTKPSYRNDQNIEAITMAILDLDRPGALEKAERLFADFEYVVYSTHSYTAQTPHKFRIVLKLEAPIPAADWPNAFQALISGIDADKVCGNLSRIFYLPSASPNAGITPFSRWNRGRNLTPVDIEKIGLTFLGEMSKRPTYLKSLGLGEERKYRHFSGADVPYYERILSNIDCSWEGYKERHKASLGDLIKYDSRHAFALSVISREISKFGDQADMRSMIQFIYRSALVHSSRAINDGNTSEEIPEMIASAFIKFAPSVLSNRYGDRVSDLYQEISEHIEAAENAEFSDKWDFPGSLARNEAPARELCTPYAEMRMRHKDLMRQYLAHKDHSAFLKSVIQAEGSGGSGDITACIQFAFRAIKGFYTNVVNLKGADLQMAISDVAEKISENARNEQWALLMPAIDPQKFQAYFRTAVQISQAAANGDIEWLMKTEPATSQPANAMSR